MKFVFFGYDFMMDSLIRLVDEGHELMGIFSFECDNIFNFNTRTQAYAAEKKTPFIINRPTQEQIENLTNEGTECFLAAGYPYKIPPVDTKKSFGINFHPSLLPKCRGLMPTPHIIIHAPEASGITVHKMTQEFDKGDILYQEELPLSNNEDVESLSARIAMRAPDVLSMVMDDLPNLWKSAVKQNENEATYFPPPDDNMRLLDWNKSTAEISRTGRAFGRYGSLARFDNLNWAVYDFTAWKEKHNLKPGAIALRMSRHIVIAAKDGFVCLKEFQKIL